MTVTESMESLAPDYEIIINGTPLPVAAVLGVTVDDDVRLPSMFTLDITGSDDQEGEFAWIDNKKFFAVGHTVKVKMGHDGALETLIIGEITGLEPEFAFDRPPSLRVRGYDRRHRLLRGRKTRTFIQQKDSDIARQIATEAGLTGQVKDSQVEHDYVLQANQTDMEFLQKRAQRIQYEVLIDDKTLLFRPVANAESAIMTLTMYDDLLEFTPFLSSMRQVNQVIVRAWSPKTKQAIVGKAAAGDEVSKMGGQTDGAALIESSFGPADSQIGDRPAVSQAAVDQLAKARFNNVSLTLVQGEGVCKGRTDLRAGIVIKIDGIGKRFSGLYYVKSAVHRYTPQHGYLTHFAVGRSAI